MTQTVPSYLSAWEIGQTSKKEEKEKMRVHSKYFDPLRLVRPTSNEEWFSREVGSALIGSLVVAILVVVLAVMCVMRWRRKEPGEEEYGLSHSLQQLCRRLRGQQWVPTENPIDLPPIPEDQIISAYVERHKDADFGFQQEFEVGNQRRKSAFF
jgi:hypothetical protein